MIGDDTGIGIGISIGVGLLVRQDRFSVLGSVVIGSLVTGDW